MYRFEVKTLSWHKRRKPSASEKKVIESFEVEGFEKVREARCVVRAVISGEEVVLNGRVTANETYKRTSSGLEKVVHGWSINAIDHRGNQILLKVIEDD